MSRSHPLLAATLVLLLLMMLSAASRVIAAGIVIEGAAASRQFPLAGSQPLTNSAASVRSRILIRAAKDLSQSTLGASLPGQAVQAAQTVVEVVSSKRILISGAKSTFSQDLSGPSAQLSGARIIVRGAKANKQFALVRYPGVSERKAEAQPAAPETEAATELPPAAKPEPTRTILAQIAEQSPSPEPTTVIAPTQSAPAPTPIVEDPPEVQAARISGAAEIIGPVLAAIIGSVIGGYFVLRARRRSE